MVYSVPVNAALEVPSLAVAGAGELYCGLQESWWTERYGEHDSISRRQGKANLASREELAETAAAARRYGIPLYLALNGQYDERQLDYLLGLVDAFAKMGGTGVIVRDLGLLYRLEEAGNALKRVCSLLAVCANAPSAAAFARLGVSRIVFPRFLGAEEIGDILRVCMRDGLQLEAESMLFFDKCPLVDGYCTHYHGVSYPDRVGTDAELEGEPLYVFDTTYRTHACLGRSCDYLEPYPCAACEIERLRAAGVGFGKLGGRGRPLEERVRALTFLKAAEESRDDEERKRLYRQTFGQPCACYYGAGIQSRTAIEPVDLPDAADRTYVGDVRDGRKLRDAIRDLPGVWPAKEDASSARTGIVLLVGPLPQSELESRHWEETMHSLLRTLASLPPADVDLCANDVGTFVVLGETLGWLEESLGSEWQGRLKVTPGPLLTRGDKPAEFEHFLNAGENPPRPVWDLEGRPRVLVHRGIVGERIWDHWEQQMAYECRTSYRRALAYVGQRQGR
ncbi:MAG: U32 family peptidase [Atopobiaceae bacterium]|nr:U32 family peptidase [Atopobiaceae bacterium]